jgi:hypothetical protein
MTEPHPSAVELPGTESSAAPDRQPDTPRGADLWEQALEGTDAGVEVQGGFSPRPAAPRRAFRPWMIGVIATAAVAGVVFAVVSLQAGEAAPGSSDQAVAGSAGTNPGASPSPPRASPGSQSPCSAQAVGQSTPAGATAQIVVSHVPPGAAITVDLAYPGGTARYSVPSSSSGVTEVAVTVPNAPPGSPVQVAVAAGGSTCATVLTEGPTPQG